MNTTKTLHLTDSQYLRLLEKVQDAIMATDRFYVHDNTCVGSKEVSSNIGLCNEMYTDIDTALFPHEFISHNRHSMKYRKSHQFCPFDSRLAKAEKNEPANFLNGCYYTCILRKPKYNKQDMFDLVLRAKELLKTQTSEELINSLVDRYFPK